MLVCICKRVNDEAIQKSIDNGSSSIEDIKVDTGACTQCGKCCKMVTEMIDHAGLAQLAEAAELNPVSSEFESQAQHQ